MLANKMDKRPPVECLRPAVEGPAKRSRPGMMGYKVNAIYSMIIDKRSAFALSVYVDESSTRVWEVQFQRVEREGKNRVSKWSE